MKQSVFLTAATSFLVAATPSHAEIQSLVERHPTDSAGAEVHEMVHVVE